jgi:hypothetical protein
MRVRSTVLRLLPQHTTSPCMLHHQLLLPCAALKCLGPSTHLHLVPYINADCIITQCVNLPRLRPTCCTSRA